jgi:hypothetical protein
LLLTTRISTFEGYIVIEEEVIRDALLRDQEEKNCNLEANTMSKVGGIKPDYCIFTIAPKNGRRCGIERPDF